MVAYCPTWPALAARLPPTGAQTAEPPTSPGPVQRRGGGAPYHRGHPVRRKRLLRGATAQSTVMQGEGRYEAMAAEPQLSSPRSDRKRRRRLPRPCLRPRWRHARPDRTTAADGFGRSAGWQGSFSLWRANDPAFLGRASAPFARRSGGRFDTHFHWRITPPVATGIDVLLSFTANGNRRASW